MRNTIATAVLLMMTWHAHAQCILINIAMNECAVCRGRVKIFDQVRTGIPTYAIFPQHSRSDSAEIEASLQLARNNIHLLFNDQWHSFVSGGQQVSHVVGLDADQQVIYKSLLSEYSDSGFQSYRRYIERTPAGFESVFTEYQGGRKYVFDLGLNSLKVLDIKTGGLLHTFRSSAIDLHAIQAQLKGTDRIQFDRYAFTVNAEIPEFAATYLAFAVRDNGDVILRTRYPHMRDSALKNIDVRNCLMRFDSSGKLKGVHLIRNRSTDVLYDFAFLLSADDSELRINTTSYDYFEKQLAADSTKEIYYISKFKLKDGRYVYSGVDSLPVPAIHRRRYFENELSSNLSRFPYISQSLTNKIYNVKSRSSISIIPDSLYNASLKPSVSSYLDESFRTFGVRLNAADNTLIVPYKYEKDIKINIYNPDLQLIKAADIGTTWLHDGSTLYSVYAFPEIDALNIEYYQNDRDKVIKLPLSLFY